MHVTTTATLSLIAPQALPQRTAPDISRPAWELLASAMPLALENGEFEVVYQPIVSLDGTIKGCEALLRWRRPDGCVVSPAAFISAAEYNGFVSDLGEFVLRQAVRQLLRFDEASLGPLYMSVNVSPRQLEQPGFENLLADVLEEFTISPSRIALEITEGVALPDCELINTRLARIAASGVRLVLDDFGTGYSGPTYLRRYSVSALKIDQSFVRGLPGEESSQVIVASMVGMAKALRVQVIAEGVETREQASFLEALGVDYLQGFLFGRPMAPEELLAYFTATRH